MASKQALDLFRGDLNNLATHFQAALPVTARKYLTPDRISRVVLNALSRSEQLIKCTRPSVLLAVMDCVQVGLEPGGPLGHAYLVPFRNNKTGKHEATPIIGYKGYVTLAMRSGLFRAPPYANLVYEADRFELDLGGGEAPIHTFDHRIATSDRGEVLGAYCVAKFAAGGVHCEYMSRDQIDAIKSRSKSAKASFSPWHTDEAQMQRKTVIRRAKNYWPISGELAVPIAGAFEIDARADDGDKPDPSLVYDASFLEDVADVPDTVDADDQVAGEGADRVLEQMNRNRKRAGSPCAVPDCSNEANDGTTRCAEHKQ